MIKVMIVAGTKSQAIREYMEKTSGGSLEIVGAFNSFRFDKDVISENYYNLDKLVYLLDIGDIRLEMESLFELMSKGISFKTRELILFYNEDTVSQGLQFFTSIMSDLNYTNYTMEPFSGDISLTEIYRRVLDIAPDTDAQVKRKVVYRVERGEMSKRGYDPTDFEGIIEPSEEDNVASYDEIKTASKKAETGRPVVDNLEFEIDKVDIHSEELLASPLKNIILIAGKERSGLTTFASNLAKSVIKSGKTVSYIDLSKQSHCSKFKSSMVIDNRTLLLGESFSKSDRAYVYDANLDTDYSKLSMLRLLIGNRQKYLPTDYIMIEVTIDLLSSVRDVVGLNIKSVFYVTESVKKEIRFIKSIMKSLEDNYIYLNTLTSFATPKDRYRPIEVKNMLKCSVIDTIEFTSFIDISSLVLGVDN